MKKVVEDQETLNHFELLSTETEGRDSKTGEIKKVAVIKDYKEYRPELKDYVEVPENKKEIYVKEFVDFSKRFSLVLDL